MKKTIEEVAEDYANYNEQSKKATQEAVKFGAKYQSEQKAKVFIKNTCNSCKESIADEFIPKCYCPDCGNEWQSEQMYSHEEVNQYILDVMSGLLVLTIKEWKESKK